MKNLTIGLALAALLVAAAYGSYVWGWYSGVNHHAVLSGMSEAKWSLAAAKSLRMRDPALALELIEANISWLDASLNLDPSDVPENERANYQLVLDRLEEYKRAYQRTASD